MPQTAAIARPGSQRAPASARVRDSWPRTLGLLVAGTSLFLVFQGIITLAAAIR